MLACNRDVVAPGACAQGDAFGLDRHEAMQAQGHVRGVPIVKRSRTCAVLEGRQAAGLRGLQLGSLAKQADKRRLICKRPANPS